MRLLMAARVKRWVAEKSMLFRWEASAPAEAPREEPPEDPDHAVPEPEPDPEPEPSLLKERRREICGLTKVK